MPPRRSEALNLPPAAGAKREGRVLTAEAYLFREPGCELRLQAGSKDASRWAMKAYSGIPFAHPLWGMMAIDLATLKVRGQKLPIIRQHDPSQVIGFSDKVAVSEAEGLQIEGVFSRVTAAALEVQKLAAEGFEWQASVGLNAADLEWVSRDETATVNGRKLKGPGTIMRNAVVGEVSFVVSGADPRTKVRTFAGEAEESPREILYAFSQGGQAASSEEERMSDRNGAGEGAGQGSAAPAITAAPTFSQADLDARVAEAIRRDREAEAARTKGIRAFAAKGQEELAQRLIDEGKTLEFAKDALMAELKVRHESKLAALTKDPAPGLTQAGASPAPAAGSRKPEDLDEKELILGGGRIDEAAAKAKFASSRALQSEFHGSELTYLACLRAESRGEIRSLPPRD
jgi:hypothetical protein